MADYFTMDGRPWPLETEHPAIHDYYHGYRLNIERQKTEILTVLVGWLAGELTEGAAARMLHTDRLQLRKFRDDAAAEAKRQWATWREANPPEPKAGEHGPGSD